MPAKLDTQLCFALYSASNHLKKVYRPLLEPYDLTYTQFLVILALGEQNNVSVSCLAKRVGINKATITPLLKRLEEKDFIKRTIQKSDERQKNITLTNNGNNLLLQSSEITNNAFCSSGLSKKEAQEMIKLCQKIIQEKEEHVKPE